MRYQGKIIKWYEDKGFGFIRATQDSKDVFLHISEIHKLNKRPQINESVTYEIAKDEKGRFRAENVGYQSAQTNTNKSDISTSFSYVFLTFIFLFLAFVIERALMGFLPHIVPFIFVGANLIVFSYYYQDKASAIRRNWRTPESTLHFMSLMGGWGGAYIAQKMFRHKYKKTPFMVVYKLTVLINCSVIILYSVPELSIILNSI
jgi:uncharacterized membrane protein YsdA (DUF1294 family)/cold shock CspA family protein